MSRLRADGCFGGSSEVDIKEMVNCHDSDCIIVVCVQPLSATHLYLSLQVLIQMIASESEPIQFNSIQFICIAHFHKLQICLRVLYNLYR